MLLFINLDKKKKVTLNIFRTHSTISLYHQQRLATRPSAQIEVVSQIAYNYKKPK